ncbi:general substrate transporter [Peniophora sp. CONT]|nr:general substrate transporter [Peniophora sp. CONT]
MSSHEAVTDERRFDEKREFEKRDTLAPTSSSPDLTEAEVNSHLPRFRGRTLTALISFIAGTGFTLFGYDQGVMSALLTANQFEKTFPQVVESASHPNHATLQSFVTAIYEVGCLFGALSNLWVGDRLGRRKTIAAGGVIMIIGAILQTTSFSYSQLVVARIITGFGNGLNTSTVPAYHAECSSADKRGSYIMLEGTLIAFGIMVSYWIDFGFYWIKGSSAQWRVPISMQIVFAVIMILGVAILPESPRWLAKKGRNAEALAVLAALRDRPYTDPDVQQTYHGIREAVYIEEQSADSKDLKVLLTHGPKQNFRRAAIAVTVQCFQQITGINLITYYATVLFERLGLSDVDSRIIAACNGTEYFLASFLGIYLIDRVGRRPLILWCAAGQSVTMILLAILGSINNSAAQIVSAVLLFVFNSFFAVGFLGLTWLYAAEVVGLNIRAPANALSTASNWIFNFVVVMIVGPSFQNINWGTYIVFAGLNAFIFPISYLFFPETKGRSLEDMDIIFAVGYREGVSPVKVAARRDLPQAGTPEADEVLGISVHHREKMREAKGERASLDGASSDSGPTAISV